MTKHKKKQMDIDDYLNTPTEKIDMQTGEITSPKLNEVIVKITPRRNGSKRVQQDFSNCPTLAEQHTAHLTDINYLIKKYKPDELAAYIAAKNQYRQEIVGHDFSKEPSLMEAKNIIYRSQQEFENLSDDIKKNFRNHVEFLKFIDNPANAEKMIKLGILTTKQVENLQSSETTDKSDAKKDVKDDAKSEKK